MFFPRHPIVRSALALVAAAVGLAGALWATFVGGVFVTGCLITCGDAPNLAAGLPLLALATVLPAGSVAVVTRGFGGSRRRVRTVFLWSVPVAFLLVVWAVSMAFG